MKIERQPIPKPDEEVFDQNKESLPPAPDLTFVRDLSPDHFVATYRHSPGTRDHMLRYATTAQIKAVKSAGFTIPQHQVIGAI